MKIASFRIVIRGIPNKNRHFFVKKSLPVAPFFTDILHFADKERPSELLQIITFKKLDDSGNFGKGTHRAPENSEQAPGGLMTIEKQKEEGTQP